MRRTQLILWLVAGLVPIVAACDSGTISKKKAESFVDRWGQQASKSLDQQVAADGAAARFETNLKADARTAENDLSRTEPRYDALVGDVYTELGWKLRLASDQGLTDRGEAVWKLLQQADSHALETEGFEFQAIELRLARIDEYDKKVASLDSFALNDRERKAAVDWLVKQKRDEFELNDDNFNRLVEAVIDSKVGDRLAGRMENLRKAYEAREKAVADLEQLLATNAMRYSRKMKHFRIDHVYVYPNEDDYWSHPVIQRQHEHNLERPDEDKGPYLGGHVWRKAAQVADDMKQPVAILHRRMRQTLKDVLTADKPTGVLRDLQPDHPQYASLQEEYARYRTIVDNGGWQKVSPTDHLGPGVRREVVSDLKKRLQAEGYYPEESNTDQLYDAQLEDAVEAYQTTHQMDVTGRPHHMFWVSLNTPATYRMRQIGLNLKRWRESNVRHDDPVYALVNIPGFRTELWQNQQRKMRFRIVVGNNDKRMVERKNKPGKKETTPNHTPELSAYIDRVIYNPFWNVTDRIRKTEILPKVRRSVVDKYKARLRQLRRQKRGPVDKPNNKQQDKENDPFASSSSQYFVSANSSGDSSESGISIGPFGGPDDQSGNVEGSNGSESDSSGKSKKSDEPEISVDDLYRMVDDDDSAVEEVQKKALFDVEAVRTLIEKAQAARQERQKDEGASPIGDIFGMDKSNKPQSVAETEPAKTTGDDQEKKSPLERKFPYLDPETGAVDISSTDPDNVPKWYEENDYEVMFPGKEWEYVRMTQGDHNALGRVKVIFPNPHAVYLHDTPKQDLFSRKIRAFSHGCMRMHKPMEFAKKILQIDGQYEDINVRRLLKGKEKPVTNDKGEKTGEKEKVYTYKPIFLERQIPVHVEYFTVRVDENGRANFFADIYDKDKKALEKSDEDENGSTTGQTGG